MRLVPCPCVVLNGHGRNSSRHATWRTRRRTGRRRLLADFQGHRHAIAERHDRRDHPRVFRKPFVVGPDGLGLARSVLAGHVAAPEDIVRDEESSDPEAYDGGIEDRGIARLVDVVEDVVEGALQVLQNPLGVTDEDLDFRRDAGLLHVLPRDGGRLGIVFDRDEFAIVRQRTGEPGARVSDRGAELKDPPRTGRARQDMEQTSLRRPDDRPSFLLALSLHGPKRRVSPVRQPIDVFVDLLVHDCARHATTAATSVVCRYEPSRQLDKHLSHMSGHRGAGWDMCKLTKTDSAVLSLYLETLYVNEIMARGYAVPPNLEVPAPARPKLTG